MLQINQDNKRKIHSNPIALHIDYWSPCNLHFGDDIIRHRDTFMSFNIDLLTLTLFYDSHNLSSMNLLNLYRYLSKTNETILCTCVK